MTPIAAKNILEEVKLNSHRVGNMQIVIEAYSADGSFRAKFKTTSAYNAIEKVNKLTKDSKPNLTLTIR